jgi:guanylate kinase
LEVKNKNFCIVLSSPSGAGKTSLSKKILQKDKSIRLSISCTTRPKRKGEINRKDYLFISDNSFKKKNQNK